MLGVRFLLNGREVSKSEYDAHFDAMPRGGHPIVHHGAWNAREREAAGKLSHDEANGEVLRARVRRGMARARSRQGVA